MDKVAMMADAAVQEHAGVSNWNKVRDRGYTESSACLESCRGCDIHFGALWCTNSARVPFHKPNPPIPVLLTSFPRLAPSKSTHRPHRS